MNPKRLLQHFNEIAEAPDAVPRLRRFILDLAVRGKLVKQNPEDEPASELLKRILVEKDQLEKKGIIRKSLALAPSEGIKTPFEIPPSWKWTRLGDSIIDHKGGGTPSKNNSSYWDGEIFWASVKDIGKSKYVDQTIDRITKAGLDNSSSNLIPSGNLIVVTRMGLGKVSINRVPIAINQDLRALFISNLAAIDFYYIFFKTTSYEGSGLTVKGIKIEELLSLPFPLPPFPEQHRIVAKVDKLMALCDELEAAQQKREQRRDRLVAATLNGLGMDVSGMDVSGKDVSPKRPQSEGRDRSPNGPQLIKSGGFGETALPQFFLTHLPRLTTRPEHIQQLRQTILNLAVRGKLIPQDPNDEPASELLNRLRTHRAQLTAPRRKQKENSLGILKEAECPFELPNTWKWIRLGEVSTLITKGSTPTSYGHVFVKSGINFIKVEAIKDGRISAENVTSYISEETHEFLKRSQLQNGDFLFSIAGSIGTCAVVTNSILPANINQALAIIRGADAAFFVSFLQYATRSCLLELALAKARGGAMNNISLEDVRNFALPLPPLPEQHRIVAKVDELMAICDELESQLTGSATARHRFIEATLNEAIAI